jgi:hypothetical protein
MSSVEGFLTKQNVDILWEIIEDNEMIQTKNPIQREQVNLFFKNMIREFNQREKESYTQLMSMNKAFITTFFTVLNTHYNGGGKKQTNATLVTHEQLQEQRLNDFDKDLERRKREFTNAMTTNVPVQPKFNDEKDSPIEEIDFMVKQMAVVREMELSNINNGMNKQDAEKWLQPSETSVKNDKYISPKTQQQQQPQQQPQQPNGKVYIKITDEKLENNVIKKDAIDLNKQLTWEDIQEKMYAISLQNEKSRSFLDEENNTTKPNHQFELEALQKQITNLHNTLEAHMEKCNNTLSIIYSLLAAKKATE